MNSILKYPEAVNEPVKSYAPGTPERAELESQIKSYRGTERILPMIIAGKPIETGQLVRMSPPHDHNHTLGYYHKGNHTHVADAVEAARKAKPDWENMPAQARAAIFMKAAELAAGPFRQQLNAATLLAQSKTPHQAEIDAACELIDFLRFNVQYMTDLYAIQPDSAPGIWNQLEYRPLEGFIFAVTPFNFTAIAANLPSAPALLGNTVVWKPADTQIYSAYVIMELFQAAGLPPGVINLVYTDGPEAGDVIFSQPDFAGLHFTGSTGVFNHLWKTIANHLDVYSAYPRIVGETGGKDFILAHPSADAAAVATAISRGAFEFQGQKCSSASRAYLPQSLANRILEQVTADVKSFGCGMPEDFKNFFTAVIDERAFDKISGYIAQAKADGIQVLTGGGFDKRSGYFIEPTTLVVNDPKYRTMCEEIFGPVISVYVYPDHQWSTMLQLVDQTSPYSLTGAVFAQDRQALLEATHGLRNAAGNFYLNDKPTGAVVNQQPFGGGRKSGTNDKAGSMLNLLRWVNARTIKETFVPPTDYRYPFLG
jgi:1-pyrroline-5-carboxylate dehydrogenase